MWYTIIQSNTSLIKAGLGKTVQTVAMLEKLRYFQAFSDPFLVVVPASSIPVWKRVFDEWSDIYYVEYFGSKKSRLMAKKFDWYYKNTTTTKF